jgi:hypothetical protein
VYLLLFAYFSCLPRPRSLGRSDWYHVSCASIYDRYQLCTCALHEARRSSLFPSPTVTLDPTILLSIPRFPLMSHTHPTSTSSNFQPILDSALKAYKRRTKKDLLKHPLADRLQACNSASSILTVLQEQVQELNESQRSNIKWLEPTVNVLHTFSETLREGVGSVCFWT